MSAIACSKAATPLANMPLSPGSKLGFSEAPSSPSGLSDGSPGKAAMMLKSQADVYDESATLRQLFGTLEGAVLVERIFEVYEDLTTKVSVRNLGGTWFHNMLSRATRAMSP